MQHGDGIEVWGPPGKHQATYVGKFYKGKKHGPGCFKWEDGSYYEGNFDNGMFSGNGKYYFADMNKLYEGEFRFGKMEGKGIETWYESGRRYEGDFKEGKKDGEGTYYYGPSNIDPKYIGTWRGGKQHGIGIMITCPSGDPSKMEKR
jgi:hypothetical protein